MSHQYEMETSASKDPLHQEHSTILPRRNPRCCSEYHPYLLQELPRYGLDDYFVARSGETFQETFQIQRPNPGYIVVYMEQNIAYISLDIVLNKRELIPTDDFDAPDHLKRRNEIKYFEVDRCEGGEVLEIPGDCWCDYMVHGIITFNLPKNVTPGSLNSVLVIDNNNIIKEISLQLQVT